MFFAKVFTFALIFVFANSQRNTSNFVAAINGFTNRFYKVVGDSQPGRNTVISGFSASTCLSFLSIGTRGATQQELLSALGFQSQADVESGFQTALVDMRNVQGITLNIANKVYVKNIPGLDMEPTFKQKAVDVFLSEAETIDFGASDQAIATINAWAAAKTNQKITNALAPRSVNADTRIVLVNAVYFKGLWDVQFDPKNTQKADFNVDLNKIIQVDMMTRTDIIGNLRKDDWEANIVELPYKQKQASMIIIVPDKIDGLAQLETKVAASNIKQDVFDGIQESKISFSMPKFKIESDMDLKKLLPKLKIDLIFDPLKSDMTGLLNTKENLYVSTAVQKAFIEVNEEGTEAAAVTVIGGSTFSLPTSIICDRPFLFFVKLKTGEILFSGRYTGSDTATVGGNGNNNTNGNVVIVDELMKKHCLQFKKSGRLVPEFCKKYLSNGPSKRTYPFPVKKRKLGYKP